MRHRLAAIVLLLLSMSTDRVALSQGWIQGEGANLNGRPLDAMMRGFGDRLVWTFDIGDGARHNVSSVDLIVGGASVESAPPRLRHELDALRRDQSLDRARFLTLWVTADWEAGWFPPREVQAALDAGITPVFLDWYFGDDLLSGDPRVDVPPRLEDYAAHSRRLGRFLGQFDGDVMVVVEPELNKPAIEDWPEFGVLLRRYGITEIRRGVEEINAATGRETTVLYGVALTDNGLRSADRPDEVYGSKAEGDSYGWTLSRPLLESLRPDLDFVGFQQILAQFHRDPAAPERPMVNTVERIGLRRFPLRLINYARYLREQLGLPIFVPYVGLPTATWIDANGNGRIEAREIDEDGWVQEVGAVLVDLRRLEAEMRDVGVIGVGAMMLFDDPVHDLGGYQYLLQNEYALGLVATDADAGKPGATFGPVLQPKRMGRELFPAPFLSGTSLVELFFGD